MEVFGFILFCGLFVLLAWICPNTKVTCECGRVYYEGARTVRCLCGLELHLKA